MSIHMLKRILFLVLITLFALELYQFSSYFPIKAEGTVREDVFAEILGQKQIEDEPSVKGIYVKYDSEVEYSLVRANTPLEALRNMGYIVNSDTKLITTSLSDSLINNSIIVIQTYKTVIEEKTIAIPFETIRKGSPLCPRLSRTKVEQKGMSGVITYRIEKLYLEDELIDEKIIEKNVIKEPIDEILTYVGANHTPTSAQNLGYNCKHWDAVVDSLSATEEEKRWLKFTMKGESGCNAESNKGYYKGLFQWDPCLWYRLYPNQNIFDGNTQIRITLQKVRDGANPKNMWPGVYKKYVAKYGELSWLK